MKKLFLILIVLIVIFSTSDEVFAVQKVRAAAEGGQNRASAAAERKETAQTQVLENLKQRAIKLIDNRIKSLNRLLERIQNDKKLTDEEKTSLNKDIQTQISGLNALKTKIQADATAADVRADAKKIITDFKVYAIFEPKIRLLITIDNLTALSTKIGELSPKIQDLINTQKAADKDVSKLQTLLDDINNQLKDINTKLAADKAKILGVSASSQNARQVFVEVRRDLALVRANFAKIRSDIAKMREEFKINIKKSTAAPRTSSSSAK